MLKLVLILAYICIIKLAFSFPSGAPVSTCESMRPSHSGAQVLTNGEGLFNISFNNHTNSSINVHLTSHDSEGFLGFILQGRRLFNKTPLGKWFTNIPQTKTIDCFGLEDSAVTHNLGGHQHFKFNNLTFTWFYPSNSTLENVYFVATVVKKYDLIYLNITKALVSNDFN